ncbi:universal stress protein [Liquorilactobacillus satsumensis]|nr:universal stress protein [Liquorilactobacillus satsumensis]MCC7666077.1 universal stress protein [Liquorilactobacillus satsumensis]MCP9312531.1 universal stress protein [Liquorilactobacillus satsumensis]MCP9328834.1 universal stress protein [Liquorilactobacillus satsumensis]MCP9356816.1 universal stress protein [Liquorilactobacillus satsumensis]MCP9360505.1 universal stress protein [Liquorilactobacillus satsumensis]
MAHKYAHILVAVDGSDGAEVALNKAIESVKHSQGATLDILRVLDLNSLEYGGAGIALDGERIYKIEQANEDYMLKLKERLLKDNEIEHDALRVHLRFGNPKIVILDFQKEYQNDLIIVGSTGKNFIERLVVGSVASYIIRNANCDVLMARTAVNKSK